MNKLGYMAVFAVFLGCKTESNQPQNSTDSTTQTPPGQIETKNYKDNSELKLDVSKESYNDYTYGKSEAVVILSREDEPLTIDQIVINNNYVLLSDTIIYGEIPLDKNCIKSSETKSESELTKYRGVIKSFYARNLVYIDSSITKEKSTCQSDFDIPDSLHGSSSLPPVTELTHYSTTYKYSLIYERKYTLELGEKIKLPKRNFYKMLVDPDTKNIKFQNETPKGEIIKIAIFTNKGVTAREWQSQ